MKEGDFWLTPPGPGSGTGRSPTSPPPSPSCPKAPATTPARACLGPFRLPNDARAARCIGAAPPTGHGPHRYFTVVHALDVDTIGVSADATPAALGFTMAGRILGRAILTAPLRLSPEEPP